MKTKRDIKFWAMAALTASLPAPAVAQHAGMVRLARVSYTQGPVSWRPSASVGWSRASYNIPVRQGGAFWAPGSARAEMVFDDGSACRLTDGAYCTLSNLYSDPNGEYTDCKLTGGASYVRIRHAYSIYQYDTPNCSIRASGPSAFQVWNGPNTQVACTEGTIQCDGPAGKFVLNRGDDMVFTASHSAERVALPAADDWATFNNQRDAIVFHTNANLPANVGLVAGELDTYGSWRDVPHYGHVWYPHQERGWRPYHSGSWTWVNPVGWTWVGAEPWGWAPYHYGTWVSGNDGWGWVPGPETQYWSPAVVGYCSYNNDIAWAPLAPAEVVYPSGINVGFGLGNWGLYFSIGGVADYCPGPSGACIGYPFALGYVNNAGWRDPSLYASVSIGAYFGGGRRFVPVNAYAVAGASYAPMAGFGTRGNYAALDPRGGATYFRNGRSFSPRVNGGRLAAAPMFARATRASITPTRSFVRDPGIPRSVASRSAYHATNWSGASRRAADVPMRNVAAARGGGARAGAMGAGATRPGGAAMRGAAGGAAGSAAARQAAAARAALGYHGRMPANAAAMNHRAMSNEMTAARRGVANGAAAKRTSAAQRTAENHGVRANQGGMTRTATNGRTANHAATNRTATNRTATNRTAAAHHSTANRTAFAHGGTTSHAGARALRYHAPARLAAPARRATPARRSAPVRRSPPARTFRAPRASAPRASAPRPTRSFSAPRSAPRASAPRMSAPRQSAPRQSAPRPSGGGGNRRRGG